jgi:UPF0755 protein
MKKRFIILFALIIVGIIVITGWWSQSLKPIDPTNTKPITFIVSRGEDPKTISDKLFKAELIRSPIAFYILSRFGGFGQRFQAGEFNLSPSLSMYEIADSLTHGTMDTRITIPEGLRREEIAQKLSKELNIPESEFIKNAKEGYLFPETYSVPKDANIDMILTMFQKEFDKKVTTDIRKKAGDKKISLNELLIIASLVEREGKHDSDRPIIASVILNRLKQDMKLDIDATVQYAVGYQPNEKTWWKKELTYDDLKIKSPYNTYINAGLPPSPICNPGIAAIQAVVNAPDTNYIYYISDAKGTLHPAATLEEHNKNISKYLGK